MSKFKEELLKQEAELLENKVKAQQALDEATELQNKRQAQLVSIDTQLVAVQGEILLHNEFEEWKSSKEKPAKTSRVKKAVESEETE